MRLACGFWFGLKWQMEFLGKVAERFCYQKDVISCREVSIQYKKVGFGFLTCLSVLKTYTS